MVWLLLLLLKSPPASSATVLSVPGTWCCTSCRVHRLPILRPPLTFAPYTTLCHVANASLHAPAHGAVLQAEEEAQERERLRKAAQLARQALEAEMQLNCQLAAEKRALEGLKAEADKVVMRHVLCSPGLGLGYVCSPMRPALQAGSGACAATGSSAVALAVGLAWPLGGERGGGVHGKWCARSRGRCRLSAHSAQPRAGGHSPAACCMLPRAGAGHAGG